MRFGPSPWLASNKYVMATATQIITNALARLGVVGAGRTPSDDDAALGLTTLRDMLRTFIHNGTLGDRYTVYPTSSYTAREGDHVFRNNDDALTISLPELVNDHASWTRDYGEDAIGTRQRTPRDGAFVIITDPYSDPSLTVDYIYDGAEKSWIEVGALEAGDYVPFSHRDQMGLSACLAGELADYFGAEVPKNTEEKAKRFKASLSMDNTQADVSDDTPTMYF